MIKLTKIEYVKKRDGSVVPFDEKKIEYAVYRAFKEVGRKDMEATRDVVERVVEVLGEVYAGETPHVEQIQDVVERVLMELGHSDVAKAYIIYRKQRADTRDFRTLLSSVEIIDSYINKTDWRVKENSNMSFSLQGLNNHLSSTVVSNYWLRKIYPPHIAKAHSSGDLHIHDLGVLGAYCVGWDLEDLLLRGFTGVPGKISSKPAKHLRVAMGHIFNFFYTLQGEAAGAQAFSNFDTLLAPFIYYDGLNYKQVKQAMQEFIFNLNIPTRTGFQTPFTNLTLDLTVPSYLKDRPVIIGGKLMDKTYAEFEEEMRMINSAFAEVMSEGDAKGRVMTFPIPTYNITKDFDWDDDGLRPIFEMTAKYGIPYWSNFINSDMKPEDARSMCCRLRLDNRELRKRGGGLFGANPLTGSIGVVTLNMPRIGFISKDEDEFLEHVADLMDLAKESLIIKRKVVERFTEQGLYPYSRFYLQTIKSTYGQYWKNHFSTIGLVGMNEAMLNLFGVNIVHPEGRKFALRVMDFMRDRLGEYQEETGDIFNLEATPAEGVSYRLARIDKRQYPDIIVANEDAFRTRGAAPYYTNSTQLPVDYTTDLFEMLELQDDFQVKYTGGTVSHIFLGERIYSWKATRKLVRKVAENFRLPYFTITPTFSICPIHGYIPGEHEFCPICDEEAELAAQQQQVSSETTSAITLNLKL